MKQSHNSSFLKRSLTAVFCAAACLLANAVEVAPDIKPYEPKPISIPTEYRAYLTGPDKDTIYVAGNDVLIPLFDKLHARFKELHPNIKFKFLMWGSTLSVEGLVSEKSAFGPIGRENRRVEADYFKERFGYEVTYFKIGYDHNPNDKLSTGIWVNSTNPIKQLTKDQVKRIYSSGNGKGDITHWRQLGVTTGEWADLPIHAYMPRDTQGILAMIDEFRDFIGGVAYSPRIEWLPNGNKVIDSVAQDAFSMGLMDYWNNAMEMRGVTKWKRMEEFAPRVKFVPVAWDENTPPSDGTLTGSRHPFASPIGIDINKAPGKPLDAWLKAYCEFLVSKDAQDIINSPEMRKFGFRPLEAGDVAVEMKKIN
ncbi:PstS family phosphate ABC transporter substrate-binding protein [Pelomonas sp. KK5]|uniref:PstS family phosphate ABC transporter substrate-binding protein n=1 Tax=Pelomonas sp. KK5 TaxID=1855730 RepID=UPI001180D9DA|nr:substrate-binding domain-containing protein [Pelomonas sp. KK5]